MLGAANICCVLGLNHEKQGHAKQQIRLLIVTDFFFPSMLWFKFLLYRFHQTGDRLKVLGGYLQVILCRLSLLNSACSLIRLLSFSYFCMEMKCKDSLSHEKEERLSFCRCLSPKLAKFPFNVMFSSLSDTGEERV